MKKKLFALGAAALLVLGMTSCENEGGGSSSKDVIKLEYSGTASDKEFNLQLFEDFKAARKAAGDTKTYEITYVEHGPDKVDSEVQDWVVGPDVFEFASDKITALYEKGALAKISGPNADFVSEKNSQLGKDLVTFNGDYYAYPYTGDNTYYLQYDKSKLTAEQASSFESIFAVCEEEGLKLGYNLEEAFWSAGALFTFGADYKMTFDADGAVEKVEADFDSEKGLKAAKAIVSIMKNPYWQNAMEAPTPTNGLIGCIAGTWEIATYREALGDNYACAPMPKITVDGETKNMGAFLGGKLFGINPQRSQGNVERLVAAHELAKFLSDKECQLKRFDSKGIAPCNLEAAAEERVLASPNVKCLVEQAKFAHAQTAVPANFWSAPNTLTAGIKANEITLDNLQTAVETLNNSVKSSK